MGGQWELPFWVLAEKSEYCSFPFSIMESDNKPKRQEVDFGRGFWLQRRMTSGASIDRIMGQNIPCNSRVIDRTELPNSIVSHKSTDLRLASYRNLTRVYRLGMNFVKSLANYKGEVRMDHRKKATYHLHWAIERDDCKRILEWYIPADGLSNEQESIIEKIVTDAEILGVIVKIIRVLE